MESNDAKGRFSPLNTYVALPKDKKELIRERLHAEIESLDSEVKQPRRRRSGVMLTARGIRTKGGAIGAALVAAACLAVVVQLSTHGALTLPHGQSASKNAGSEPVAVDGLNGVASGSSQSKGLESGSGSSTSSTSQFNMMAQPETTTSVTLDADQPVALFGQYGWMVTANGLKSSDSRSSGAQGGAAALGLHRTEDGGADWQAVKLPVSGKPYSVTVAAVNGMVAQVAVGTVDDGGGHVVIYRTTDGGQSWQSTAVAGSLPGSTSGQVPDKLMFVNALDGWMVTKIPLIGMGGTAPGSLYRTTDGGETWTREMTSGFPSSSVPFSSISFITPQIGFTTAALQAGADAGVTDGIGAGVTDGHNGLYRTTDGGAHWTPVRIVSEAGTGGTAASSAQGGANSVPGGAGGAKVEYQVPVWSGSTGYLGAIVSNGNGPAELVLYQSMDEGATWTQAHRFTPGAGRSSGEGAADGVTIAASGSTVWIYWDGSLWSSADGARTFKRMGASLGHVTELVMQSGEVGVGNAGAASPGNDSGNGKAGVNGKVGMNSDHENAGAVREGFAVTVQPLPGTAGQSHVLWKTQDGGVHWSKVATLG